MNWIEGDQQYQGEEADILRQQRLVVVLGEPGMGKTELLKRLGDNPNAQFVRASAFLRWTNEQIAPGKVLVIDALDEVAAKAEGDPLHNVLKKLAELGRPPFVLSCRSAERDADRMVPLHKTIAEYLGARWLGRLVDRNQQSR